MPFRDAFAHLADMLRSIELVEQFVADMSFDQYKVDLKTKAAVERHLQIISEAARRLSDGNAPICDDPELAWTGLIGMGNVLRHAYHGIDDEIVWETISVSIPKLKAAVKKAKENSLTERSFREFDLD